MIEEVDSPAATGHFRYVITLPDGSTTETVITLDPVTLQCVEPEALSLPWTALGVHQCPGCPLTGSGRALCPMAAHLAPIVEKIGGLLSFEMLDVEVSWGPRHLRSRSSAQKIASSIIGLVVASSGCPRSAFLKPMAWFHLPFATEDETVFRSVSSYLLAQYFAAGRGAVPDWSLASLTQHYADLHEVNIAMAGRLREACKHDAIVNAVVLLDMFAKVVPYSVEDSLESLAPLFAAGFYSAKLES
jgi:hypothetical protein